jgi:hypothetical protein
MPRWLAMKTDPIPGYESDLIGHKIEKETAEPGAAAPSFFISTARFGLFLSQSIECDPFCGTCDKAGCLAELAVFIY